MPAQQSFESHAHQPTLTIVASALLTVAAVEFALSWPPGAGTGMAVGVAALIGSVFTLIWISRAYTTRLQDRIIRVEMRLRALQILTPAQQQAMATLSLKQLAALRFASDAELPSLTERAAREKLAPTDIKRAIQHWIPDFDRT
jgi:predicted phage-related endonuclease